MISGIFSDDKNEEEQNIRNQSATSKIAEDQSTQEIRYRLKKVVESKGENCETANGFGSHEVEDVDDDDSFVVDETEGGDLEELEETEPQDLSSKVKVTENGLDLTGPGKCETDSISVPADTPGLRDSVNETKENPDQHSIQFSKETNAQCPVSTFCKFLADFSCLTMIPGRVVCFLRNAAIKFCSLSRMKGLIMF